MNVLRHRSGMYLFGVQSVFHDNTAASFISLVTLIIDAFIGHLQDCRSPLSLSLLFDCRLPVGHLFSSDHLVWCPLGA